MNTSVERKIASVAEKLKDITYLFDNWATANVRLDKMPLPAMINLLPVSGKFVISRTQLKDCPNCMIAFADKTEFDFDGKENDTIILQAFNRPMIGHCTYLFYDLESLLYS